LAPPAGRVTFDACGSPDDLLHRLVREELPGLVGALGEHGRTLPRHVLSEMERFTACGDPRVGFAWLVCEDCDHHRIVPFTCHCRGFCPCCCGRRMVERAATWCDEVIPYVPVRQWVLTVPWPRRFLFARRHEAARGVLAVALHVIFGWYRDQGRALGVEDGRTGSITVVQRAGSSLNVNVHFHCLVLDGVYSRDPRHGILAFHRTPDPSQAEMEGLVTTIAQRAEAWLSRHGWGREEEDTPFDEDPDDAQMVLIAASMEGRSALRGKRTRRRGVPRNPSELPQRCAAVDGYNLHADTRISSRDRPALERLCRYILRPPLSKARLEETPDGGIRLSLRRPWNDGTTEILFTRQEFVERLCALVPQPDANTILYHGVLAAHAALRTEVVPVKPPHRRQADKRIKLILESRASETSRAWTWAALLLRVFGRDGFACPRCGRRMELRTIVIGTPATNRILDGLSKSAARSVSSTPGV
jgi:hypothetical protein